MIAQLTMGQKGQPRIKSISNRDQRQENLRTTKALNLLAAGLAWTSEVPTTRKPWPLLVGYKMRHHLQNKLKKM